MNVANLARVCGTAATIAGAASVAGWSQRSMRQLTDRTAPDLARLDIEFQTCLRTQLETARRYDLHFTLTATELDDGDPVAVARACAPHLRVLDAVTLVDGALVLLCSGTEQAGAARALDRLVTEGVLAPSSLERTGAATFPLDGFTAVSLMETAVERVGSLAPASGHDRVR